MFMLGLGPIAVVHNRTGTSFSAREIASDYWCRPKIDRLLYIAAPLKMGVYILNQTMIVKLRLYSQVLSFSSANSILAYLLVFIYI